jgi:hypothetical protein
VLAGLVKRIGKGRGIESLALVGPEDFDAAKVPQGAAA